MMSSNQLKDLAIKLNAPESIVFREYIQLIFLENLYAITHSDQIIFKGGTAIHLMYHAPRFSEDLDFTVLMGKLDFGQFIQKVFSTISLSYEITFKERKTLTGKRYLLTANSDTIKNSTFINLDFSFRETVTYIEKSPLVTEYPISVSSPVYYMGKDEIISEKIRAILTREKGRDIYDLWFLLANRGSINPDLLSAKFKYYQDKNLTLKDLLPRIESFPSKLYCDDLRPFVSYRTRETLERNFTDIKEYLSDKVPEYYVK
jgi:predicted nucleotidyltransferase component of viral defense system